MDEIEMHKPSEEFAHCWQAAGRHLDGQVDGGLQHWLRAELMPPFLEHLSFRLGNQLFFVRLEDADGRLSVPGTRRGLEAVAEGCRGIACLMPMRRRGGRWQPAAPGWGLVELSSGRPVDPPALATDEPVEMTDWELQDYGVQVVREHLKEAGRALMSWQSNPDVDPSLWFVGDRSPEWVVVRVARMAPDDDDEADDPPPAPPARIHEIARRCAPYERRGHFAAVRVMCPDTMLRGGQLLRGRMLVPAFEGLEPVPAASTRRAAGVARARPRKTRQRP